MDGGGLLEQGIRTRTKAEQGDPGGQTAHAERDSRTKGDVNSFIAKSCAQAQVSDADRNAIHVPSICRPFFDSPAPSQKQTV
jgi:hypothetical protein